MNCLIKTILLIIPVLLTMLSGCGDSKQLTEDFITVDVTTNYPKKELILQDFMDVEYISLETKDEFINQGFVRAIGKDIILITNLNRVGDGDIFVYNRTGKALRKINRKGMSAEEYVRILGITLDEDKSEMFVNDHSTKRILVYDLYGNFKRSLKHKESTETLFYTDIFNYDKDHLICYDLFNKEIAFVLISKQDGSITKEIKIPFKEKKAARVIRENEAISAGFYRSIIPFKGNWMLLELSSDTVYSFLPNYSLLPFLVRTPPIQSMNPEVFLFLRLLSERYIFMETIQNIYDFET